MEMPVRRAPSGTLADGAGCVGGGVKPASVMMETPGLPKFWFGKFCTPATKGGLPFKLVKRFPKRRSWKIP